MPQLIEFIGNHPLLFVALFATLGMIVFTEVTRARTAATALSPYAATALINEGDTLLLDVRENKEFKTGHLLNAKNFPVNKLDERLHEIDKYKQRKVMVYCDNGMRTSRALGKLRKNGFENVHSLQGGLVAWEKANLPTVTR